MTTRFTYLDDEPPETVRPYVQAVTRSLNDLEIDHVAPRPYPEQLPSLRELHRNGRLDGLILDLRLDQFPDHLTGHGRADYRAATLAQEIRTRATEGNLPEFPIVLWSTDERLRKSYLGDDTSHDLFDLKSLKESIESRDGALEIAAQLRSLVNGYRSIGESRAKYRGKNRGIKLLGFSEQPPFIDERVLIQFEGRDGSQPTHEIARFILRQLLDVSGPLIGAPVLAARLGIDIHASPGFGRLLADVFAPASYTGTFHDGWPRWWSAAIEDVWRNLPNVPAPLRSLTAADRVQFLSRKTKIKELSAAKPLQFARSSNFWTVCHVTEAPLDPKDGYLIDRQPVHLWQDRLYVSLHAVLEGMLKPNRIRVDPTEVERLNRALKTAKGS